jgi:sulfur carrier protein ThiS
MPEGSKAADAIAKAEVNADEVHIILINGVSSPPDRVLGEGDRLGLFPAVGGG